MTNDPQWLEKATRLQAIARTGLHYAENAYDIDRYNQVEAIALEMMAEGADVEFEKIPNLFERETGYVTPKMDVRGVVMREGKVLLVREIADNNRWTLPGGWADVCYSPSENIIREIREESGFETKVVRLLALFDRRKHEHFPPEPRHCYKAFFQCEIVGGQARTSVETSEVAFFDPDHLPELSVSRVTASQIRELASLVANGELLPRID